MMEKRIEKYCETLGERYPKLLGIMDDIIQGYIVMRDAYINGGKLLVAGNGGSAADSEHIVGELMKSFKIRRPISKELAEKLKVFGGDKGAELAKTLEQPLRAISLVTHEAMSTAYINDVGGSGIFAQQLLGYGDKEDVFLAISTSGNSENVVNAAFVAKAIGMKIVALTGELGGKLADIADVAICVPERETYMVQELHLPVYHCLCLMLEESFFGLKH